MDHPNIARVLDASASSIGRPFFVMEYVDGHPVTEYCDRRALGIAQRLVLFMTVCDAVDYAHRKGILHRDLKPSNILVGETDGKPAPKIIDFGIAKALGSRLTGQTFQTASGQVLGTIEYMSPEQANLDQDRLDVRTDVYSLGVVLYELLCGALPFDAERLRASGLVKALGIVHSEEPPPPDVRLRQLGDGSLDIARKRGVSLAGLERQLAGDLVAIVQTALAKDLDRRYASAASLSSDIGRFLAHQPIQARAPAIVYRASKFFRRRRGMIAAAASFSALSIATVTLIVSSRYSSPPPRPVPKVTPLTTSAGYQFDPALSPDGKRLAYVWNGDAGNYDIYVKPLDSGSDGRSVGGGDPVRLTTDPAHDLHPVWSPDGSRLAFLRVSPSTKEIWTMDSSGGSQHKLREIFPSKADWEPEASAISRIPGPDWSPDGKFFVVADR
jgi:hypothetical protein